MKRLFTRSAGRTSALVSIAGSLLLTLGLAPQAQAGIIIDVIPGIHNIGVAPFPNGPIPVGTFNYSIPAGDDIVAAAISGTFGDAFVTTTAPLEVYLDGLLVAECGVGDDCTGINGPLDDPTDWSYTFDPSEFYLLADGSADLTIIQNDYFYGVLGLSLLEIDTAPGNNGGGNVPEPGTLALIGLGLAGVGATRRRKK